jgi:predicted ATP-binding protein involved in virulence
MIDSYISPKKGMISGIHTLLNGKGIDLENIEKIDFFTIHFNYMIDTLKDSEEDEFIDDIYHRADSYKTPILLEPYKFNNRKEQIDIENLDYLSQQKFANIFRLGIKNNFIEKFFKPNLISIKINIKKIHNKIDRLSQAVIGNHLMIVDNKNPIKVGVKHIFRNTNPSEIRSKINELNDNKDYDKLNKIYLALKLLEKDYQAKFKELSSLYDAFFVSRNSKETINNTIKVISNIPNLEKDLLSADIPKFEIQKLLNTLEFKPKILDTNLLKVFNKHINEQKTDILDVNQLLEYIPPWVDIEYFEDDKSYKSLSSGEKAIYSFMINLIYQVNNIKDTEYETINIFLDETELGLHPQWQKEYLQSIILSLESFKIKINIIFATHSPFLLSDIPKENIIFLDDGKNVNNKVKIDTFGANIHTLLSHGFFMEDGLMGEFAKGEINKVITLLNKTEQLTEQEIKQCEKIIFIIGDSIIKRQLQKMLDSKRLKKIDEIDTIKQDIEIMQDKLKRLENDKNNS